MSVKVDDHHRLAQTPHHHLRGHGHRVEEAIALGRVTLSVVGWRAKNDKCSIEPTVGQIEGRVHGQAGGGHSGVEGLRRYPTIVGVKPTVTLVRHGADTLDVVLVVDPLQDPEHILVRWHGRLPINRPSAGCTGFERIQNHLNPLSGLGMTQTRVVAENPRVRTHENW